MSISGWMVLLLNWSMRVVGNTRLHKIDACSYLYMIGTYANIKDIN